MNDMEAIIAKEIEEAGREEIEIEPGVKVTRKYLSDLFDTVKDQKNWKNSINAVVPDKNREMLSHAIEFFTGSTAIIWPMFGNKIRVQAVGYYGAGC